MCARYNLWPLWRESWCDQNGETSSETPHKAKYNNCFFHLRMTSHMILSAGKMANLVSPITNLLWGYVKLFWFTFEIENGLCAEIIASTVDTKLFSILFYERSGNTRRLVKKLWDPTPLRVAQLWPINSRLYGSLFEENVWQWVSHLRGNRGKKHCVGKPGVGIGLLSGISFGAILELLGQ